VNFPELSRKPALKTKTTTLDPTLRDSYENGMESTRARYTRQRRQWDVQIEALTPDDKTALDNFVRLQAVYGAVRFFFPNPLDKDDVWTVRFSTLPSYQDAGNIEGGFRTNCSFQLREV
jgi:hypothetical protein